MTHIFKANMMAVYELDSLTHLELFMLTAIESKSDIKSIYTLPKEHPVVIMQ